MLFYKRPPGPSIFDLATIDFIDSYKVIHYLLSLSNQLGDIVFIPGAKLYLMSGPNELEYIFKTHHTNFIRNKSFYHKSLAALFGKSVLTLEGEDWRTKRRLASPAYQHQQIAQYANVIPHATQAFMADWSPDTTLNLFETMSELTFSIIAQILCHYLPTKSEQKTFVRAVQFNIKYATSRSTHFRWKPTLGNFRFQKNHSIIDALMTTLVEQRKKDPNPPDDLLSQLCQEPDAVTELKTHLITGFDTTAATLGFMWVLLAQHPQYQTWLQEELDTVLGNALPTWDDLPKLSRLQAILFETMRLYPPVWTIPRTNIEADVLSTFKLPKNSSLLLNIYALHRNPRYWHEPNRFYPERFLDTTERHPFLYLPFGNGPHRCMATHLAPVEMTLAAATIAQRFQLVSSKKITLKIEGFLSLKPRKTVWMQAIPIQKANCSPT